MTVTGLDRYYFRATALNATQESSFSNVAFASFTTAVKTTKRTTVYKNKKIPVKQEKKQQPPVKSKRKVYSQ